MPLLLAIPFALVLALGAAIASVATDAPVSAFLIIGSALWVYFDAKKLDLGRYKTGLMNPEVVTIGCFMVWIIAFPWYLSARYKIILGELPLKATGEPPRNDS